MRHLCRLSLWYLHQPQWFAYWTDFRKSSSMYRPVHELVPLDQIPRLAWLRLHQLRQLTWVDQAKCQAFSPPMDHLLLSWRKFSLAPLWSPSLFHQLTWPRLFGFLTSTEHDQAFQGGHKRQSWLFCGAFMSWVRETWALHPPWVLTCSGSYSRHSRQWFPSTRLGSCKGIEPAQSISPSIWPNLRQQAGLKQE